MLKPIKLASRNFLSSSDISCEELLHILELAKNFKNKDLNIKFKEKVSEKVPAVAHFDNTARLQTVTQNDNPWYYSFLSKWNDETGVPILLNTSFNDREPIVENPKHAVNCFLGTDIDYLYFYDYGILSSKK